MITHLNIPDRALAIAFCGCLFPDPDLLKKVMATTEHKEWKRGRRPNVVAEVETIVSELKRKE